MNICQFGSMLLSAYMFMPTTPRERNVFLAKSILVYTVHENERNNNYDKAKNFCELTTLLGIFNDFSRSVLEPSRDFYEQTYLDSFIRGMICGHILSICIGKRKSISSSTDEYIKYIDENENNNLYPYKGIYVKHTKTNIINNIWPVYKKVAVYWAVLTHSKVPHDIHSKSFIDFTKFESDNPKIKATGIEGFYSLTDTYIQLATNFIPPKSSKPLLEPHEALPVTTAINQLLSHKI